MSEDPLSLLADLNAWVRQAGHHPDLVGTGHVAIVTYGLFSACPELADALHTLLSARQGSAATILARSLFEHAIKLSYLERQGTEKRVRHAVWWFRDGLEHSRRLLVGVQDHVDWDASSAIERIDQELRSLAAFQSRPGVGSSLKFPGLKDAASVLEREDEFWMHELASALIHGSYAGAFRRRHVRAPDFVEFRVSRIGDKELDSVAVFAASTYLDAYKATAALMSWPAHEGLTALEGRLEAAKNALVE